MEYVMQQKLDKRNRRNFEKCRVYGYNRRQEKFKYKQIIRNFTKNCKKAIKIEEVSELYNEDLDNISKIGVMAGASTPKESIEEVIKYLKERN